MTFAGRMGNLGTESAFEQRARVGALEAQGREIVHLELEGRRPPTLLNHEVWEQKEG